MGVPPPVKLGMATHAGSGATAKAGSGAASQGLIVAETQQQ